MQILRDPGTDAALSFLATELAGLAQRRGHLVQAVGECEIVYRGRASSVLNRGERILLLKPDGTLLIHTAKGAKPVNWQPPGAAFSVALEGGRVVLTSHRIKPEEIVRVTFHAIRLLVAVPLPDAADLALEGTEDDLQNLLRARPHLIEAGFVPSQRERSTARGRYDLDGHDASGRRVVVEVKRGTAGVGDAQQLWRYVERLRGGSPVRVPDAGPDGTDAGADGKERRDDKAAIPRGGNTSVRGILVAPTVAPKARLLLSEHGLEWKELDWATALPQSQEVRRGGQVALGRFTAEVDLAEAADPGATQTAVAPPAKAKRVKRAA